MSDAPSDPAVPSRSGSAESTAPQKRGVRLTFKEVLAAVVAVAAVVFALLNTGKFTVNVFGWKPVTYIWLWLLIMLVLGIVVGVLPPFGRTRKKK